MYVPRHAAARVARSLPRKAKAAVLSVALAASAAGLGVTALPAHASYSYYGWSSYAAQARSWRAAGAISYAEHAAWRHAYYAWGGTGWWGYDCSGLVYAAYRHEGIYLPRTTYEMLASWHLVRIPAWEARRGDLAFYGYGHVEFVTAWRHTTLGAQRPGTLVGWHHSSSWWHPTMYFRVR